MLQSLCRELCEPRSEELAAELDMTPGKIIEVKKYGEPIRLHLVNNDTGGTVVRTGGRQWR
jgi:hypothetical protein